MCGVVDGIHLSVFLDAFAKLRKATISFAMSVRTQRTTRLALDVNLKFGDFFENMSRKFFH